MFATGFLAKLDRASLELRYCNAGHNPPFLQRADGRIEVLHHGGLLLGVFEDPRLEEGMVNLEPGDRVVCYTDGVTEARSPAGEFFGEERLEGLLRALPADLSAEDVARAVHDAVYAAAERGSEDDMTLVVLRVPARAAVELGGGAGAAARSTAEPALTPGDDA
jgi:sigma-B regulation protein RsbU (phosphoserine phosphatase)